MFRTDSEPSSSTTRSSSALRKQGSDSVPAPRTGSAGVRDRGLAGRCGGGGWWMRCCRLGAARSFSVGGPLCRWRVVGSERDPSYSARPYLSSSTRATLRELRAGSGSQHSQDADGLAWPIWELFEESRSIPPGRRRAIGSPCGLARGPSWKQVCARPNGAASRRAARVADGHESPN